METDLVIALVAILVNIGALGWAIRSFQIQRADTKKQLDEQIQSTEKLAELTSKLQTKVNLLAADLDQSLKQLERAVDIVRQIHSLMYGAKPVRELTHEDAGKINTFRIELKALVRVLDDNDLIRLVETLFEHIDKSWPDPSLVDTHFAEYWKETQEIISADSQQVCERIFELMRLKLGQREEI